MDFEGIVSGLMEVISNIYAEKLNNTTKLVSHNRCRRQLRNEYKPAVLPVYQPAHFFLFCRLKACNRMTSPIFRLYSVFVVFLSLPVSPPNFGCVPDFLIYLSFDLLCLIMCVQLSILLIVGLFTLIYVHLDLSFFTSVFLFLTI